VLVAERTALINQVRSVLLERGIAVAQGRRKLETQLPDILTDEALGLSTRIRELIADLREEWQTLNERITAFDAEFVSRARTDEAAHRLATIPGIGSINATALVAAVGDGRAFERGPLGSDWSRG
jgi:transposase